MFNTTKILTQLKLFLFYFVSITEHICSTKNKEVIFMSEKKELNLDNLDQVAGGNDDQGNTKKYNPQKRYSSTDHRTAELPPMQIFKHPNS